MKPWYESRTIWANAIAGTAAISVAFGFDLGLTPEVQSSIVAGVLAVVNVILRMITKTGIG